MSAEMDDRRAAAAVVLDTFRSWTAGKIIPGDWQVWSQQLAAAVESLLGVAEGQAVTLEAARDVLLDEHVVPEPVKLAAIREVLARWDADAIGTTDALERIEEIAGATGTATGPELSGGAYISADDLSAVLGHALADAIAYRDPAGTCTYCDEHPAGLCEDHAADLDKTDAYLSLARQLGTEAEQ
jgi:hypothetical protein